MDGFLLSLFAGYPAIAVTSSWLTADRLVILAIPLATVVTIFIVDVRDRRAARRAKLAARAARPESQWAIALLVDADEKSGILRPVVQLLGPPLPSDIIVDLRVGDECGEVRLASERRFSAPATRTDLMLGALTLPDTVPAARAALCDWAVVVGHDGHEIARRDGPLAAAPCLNDEAELQAPDVEPAPEEAEPPAVTPDPVRHLGSTIGLLCVIDGMAIGGYLLTMLTAWLWLAAVPLFLLASFGLLPALRAAHDRGRAHGNAALRRLQRGAHPLVALTSGMR